MEAFGFEPGDYDDLMEILPDNWWAFALFEVMSTQWRAGMGGATGLDYGVLPAVMRLIGIPAGERCDIFYDLRVMEAEALACMAQGKE
ncbi:DUF1799 domain-containing protein [Pseudomonas eucalypticola]|uniref:DUF1799 domain-containing protein n=2 Tax=Pseudomonas eucalypticola TaxID=2599595 RepID=A0A7D5DBX4_9PSED|nr:DUF1799 domain-containing protein [Pseudomonas eucalypticola]QKZ07732.1 DUF1799 domain-containing protein [Pseudomonas eucalypticola]